MYGLQFDRYYVTAYMPESATDVSRDTAGDQIDYQGSRFQAVQKVNWYASGWLDRHAIRSSPAAGLIVLDNQLFTLINFAHPAGHECNPGRQL